MPHSRVFLRRPLLRRWRSSEATFVGSSIEALSGTLLLSAHADSPTILSVDSAYEQLSGYTSSELVGQSFVWLCHPNSDQAPLNKLAQCIADFQPCTAVLHLPQKNDIAFRAKIRMSPMLDAHGQASHFICFILKLTTKTDEALLRSDNSPAAEGFRRKSETTGSELTASEDMLENERFLSRTAMALSKLNDEEHIYEFIGQELHGYLKDVLVVIIRKLPDRPTMRIQGIYGVDQSRLDTMVRFLGQLAVDQEFPIIPRLEVLFQQPHLQFVHEGLIEFARDVVPVPVLRKMIKRFKIDDMYLIGLQRDGVFYASVQFYLSSEHKLQHPAVLEAFILQASIAIQRAHAVDAVRKSDMLHRFLFEQSNDAVFILDLTGRYLMSNQRGIDMLGYSHDELVQLSAMDTIDASERPASSQTLQRLLAGERIAPYERLFRRKDDSVLSTEVNVELIRTANNEPLYIQSIVRDITTRKKLIAENQAFLDDMKALQMISMELTQITDLETLCLKMVELPRKQLGYDRIALFLLDETGAILRGTYGTDEHGALRDEHYYQEHITDDHWIYGILNAPNHAALWQDSQIFDNGVVISAGWKAASALWNGTKALGFLICDNLLSAAPPRAYELEMFSLLGMTFGYLIQRSQTETALRQSEARQRAMIEAIPDLIFNISRDGTYLDFFPPNTGRFAIPPSTLIGRGMKDILPEPIADELLEKIQQALETQQVVRHEYELIEQGTPYQYEIRIVPVGEDEVFSIARDMTELLSAQKALRYSEEVKRAFIEQSNDGIVLVNNDGNIIEWNHAQEKLTGIPRENALDQPLWKMQARFAPNPEQRAQQEAFLEAGIRAALRGEPVSWLGNSVETQVTRADGKSMILQSVVFVIDNLSGRMLGSTVRDITEQRSIEQRAFEIALEQERRHMLALFIQNAAHEFRTPLAIINTSSYLMARTDASSDRLVREEHIQEQVKRLTKLLEMLLKMVKLQDEVSIKTAPVDISVMVEGITRVFTAMSGGPTLILSRPPGAIKVSGFYDYLFDATYQVIENAYRFTESTGTITVTLRQANTMVELEVTDTGIGIEEANLSRIFETFWREDKAHSTPGLGLGLPITARIVELHKGEISVTSTIGQGTSVLIRLPAYSASS